MAQRLRRVESYECPKCKKVITDSRAEAEKHVQIRGIVLPKGLVFCRFRWANDYNGYDAYNVIISSALNHSHDSENDYYQLGTGDYRRFRKGKRERERYDINGDVFHLDGTFLFGSGLIKLVTQEEFEREVGKLKDANVDMIKRELKFLNQPGGIDGCWIAEPGYTYSSKDNRSSPVSRIDRAMLERYGIKIENLIRTTPELEKVARE